MRRIFKYGSRVIRALSMLCRRTISFRSFRAALRPGQVSVLARAGGMVFCDAETERAFFCGSSS